MLVSTSTCMWLFFFLLQGCLLLMGTGCQRLHAHRVGALGFELVFPIRRGL